jgi:uncharacterized membrane protein
MARGLEYSAQSLREISNEESRKGKPDPAARFDEVVPIIDALRALRVEKRAALKIAMNESVAQEIRHSFNAKSELLRDRKKEVMTDSLFDVSNRLIEQRDNETFNWGLEAGQVINSKQTFRIATGESHIFFAAKQIEHSLRRANFQIPPARNRLISQLIGVLSDRMPKTIVKADIKSFFESIPHDQVRKFWRENTGISSLTKGFLDLFLSESEAVLGGAFGLPRGVGMSSQLAETYLQDIDAAFRSMPNVMFYARYVDDIIIVVSSAKMPDAEAIKDLLGERLLQKGLIFNDMKTATYPSDGVGGILGHFDFLGYQITANAGKVSLAFSSPKTKRYKSRVEASIAAFKAHPAPTPSHEALLVNRLKFLTGNTKLSNNKRHALTGVYFSNPHLNDGSTLPGLDKFLAARLSAVALTEPFASRVQQLSFKSGFEKRIMCRFSQSDLIRVTAVWKNV